MMAKKWRMEQLSVVADPLNLKTETCKTEDRPLSLNWKSSTENLWITNTKTWQQGWDSEMSWHER